MPSALKYRTGVLLTLVVLVGLAPLEARSSGPVDPAWDTTLARGEVRQIAFTTDEGTWMSVDLAPDGHWIVFDLLGHIYRMPASGGSATCLTQDSGVALNLHPVIAPDGRRIAFVSDRGGQDGLWVMDSNGDHPRQIFMDPESRIAEPAWLPDGSGIVAVRTFPTPGRGWHRQNDRIWLFPLDGGQPRELVGDEVNQYNAPAPAPDGTLYFHVSAFSGNRYGSQTDYRVQKLAPGSSVPEDVIVIPRAAPPAQAGEAAGGGTGNAWAGVGAGNDKSFIPDDPPAAIAPQPSPDGRWLAYAREVDEPVVIEGHSIVPGTQLYLRDLATGTDRRIAPVSKDLSAAHAVYSYSVLPRYAWSADSTSILYSEGGKIRRVDVASGLVSTIPFEAAVKRTISQQAQGRHRIVDDAFSPRLLQWPASSPDGRSVAFVSAGRLWTASLPGGAVREVSTGSRGFVMTPSWSPEGDALLFTTWDDIGRGHVWLQSPGGTARRVTRFAGEYIYPSFSPDGRSVLVTRGASDNPSWQKWTDAPRWEVVLISLDSGSERIVAETSGPREASFGQDGRIYFEHQNDPAAAAGLYAAFPEPRALAATVSVRSVRADGSDLRIHAEFPARGTAFGASNLPLMSPSGEFVAFQAARDIFVVPAATGDQPVNVDPDPDDVMPGKQRLSSRGGIFHHWRSDHELEFFDGRDHMVVDVRTGKETRTPLAISIKGTAPQGRLALVNARIITIAGEEVIERGSIIADRGRITCVGRCDASGADLTLDLSGKTIMPGLVDVHSHATHLPYGIVPQHLPKLGAQVAYGVTTTVDPATDSASAFPLQDMVAAGAVPGPRIFSVGELVNSGPAPGLGGDQDEIGTYEDAERQVLRRKAWGAISIKNFRLARRDQVQKLIEAARRADMTVTSEGGPLEFDLSLAMDGQTGWEHYIANLPIYSDVARFLGMAHMTYSPTVGTTGHGRGALDFWRARHNLAADPKYTALVSPDMIPTSRDLTTIRPATEFTFPVVAAAMAAIRRNGGQGSIGEHAEQAGIGSHWEIWSYAAAMSPLDALRVGTLEGARFHGLDRDVGSIEVGKLADLVILNSNPLDDIRNTLDIAYVVIGGRVFEGQTANEVWPENRPYGPLPWPRGDASVVGAVAVGRGGDEH